MARLAPSGDVPPAAAQDTGHLATACPAPMHVVDHALLPLHSAEGVHSRRLARWALPDRVLAVDQHALDPGARWQPPSGALVLVLAGCGKLLVDGAPQRVAAPCSAAVPPGHAPEWVNNGTEALQLLVLAEAAPDRA